MKVYQSSNALVTNCLLLLLTMESVAHQKVSAIRLASARMVYTLALQTMRMAFGFQKWDTVRHRGRVKVESWSGMEYNRPSDWQKEEEDFSSSLCSVQLQWLGGAFFGGRKLGACLSMHLMRSAGWMKGFACNLFSFKLPICL